MTCSPVLALRARTVSIDDPGPLLDLLPAQGPLAWLGDGDGLVGWGEAARLEVTGAEHFPQAERWWRALVAEAEVDDALALPGTGPVMFGSFGFDPAASSSVLVVPEVVVGRRGDTCWLTTIGVDAPSLEPQPAPAGPGEVAYADGARSSAAWLLLVAEARQRILSGALSKVVLARDLEARTEQPIDVRWPMRRLAAAYPQCRTFHVDGLLGATPEVLVSLQHGVARSRVLAGTLQRSGDPAYDRFQAGALVKSSKGPGRARLRGELRRRGAGPLLLVGRGARRAVRAAPGQRDAPGQRRDRARPRRRHRADARRVAAPLSGRLRHARRMRPWP